MKTRKLIALSLLALLFSQCKTAAPTGPSGSTPSLLEVQRMLDTTSIKFLQYADSTNGDPWKALMLTANWVKSQPNVQTVATIDSIYLNIVLKSGLQADFFFNQVNDSGYSIFRGGGGRTQTPAHISFSTLSKNSITNRKVLIYAPAWTEFDLSTTVPKTVSTLTNSGLDLDVTVLKDEECTPAIANTFQDYGLVILDTHGTPTSYMSGTIIDIPKSDTTDALENAEVIRQAGLEVYDRIISKDFRIGFQRNIPVNTPNWQKRQNLKAIEKIFVTTQYLKTLPPMPNTVIFGNMCYSGWTLAQPDRRIDYPLGTAFIDKNPISYYAYATDDGRSRSVFDLFSKDMEDSLTKRLVNDLDSTGIANLRPADGAEFYDNYQSADHTLLFKHFGADDYAYMRCGDTLVDPRDGQRYATVCIGKQIWMAQNLNYAAPGSSWYDNDASNGRTYGRFYTWSTLVQHAAASSANPSGVQGVCPKGWHVPSVPEWTQLINFLGGATVAGGALKKDTTLWQASGGKPGTNSSGFSALPAGTGDAVSGAAWSAIGQEAFFGTASSFPANTRFPYYGLNLLWGTFTANGIIPVGPEGGGITPTLETSCRCVKDP